MHDDVIKWKHFPRYWPFVRGIHRSPVNSSHKGQWRGALMFCLIRAWINSWVNNCEAGDLKRYLAHCDVIVIGFLSQRPVMRKAFPFCDVSGHIWRLHSSAKCNIDAPYCKVIRGHNEELNASSPNFICPPLFLNTLGNDKRLRSRACQMLCSKSMWYMLYDKINKRITVWCGWMEQLYIIDIMQVHVTDTNNIQSNNVIDQTALCFQGNCFDLLGTCFESLQYPWVLKHWLWGSIRLIDLLIYLLFLHTSRFNHTMPGIEKWMIWN